MDSRACNRVPFEQQGHFAEILMRANAPVEAIAINTLTHASSHNQRPDPPYTVTEKHIYRFFDRHLKKAPSQV